MIIIYLSGEQELAIDICHPKDREFVLTKTALAIHDIMFKIRKKIKATTTPRLSLYLITHRLKAENCRQAFSYNSLLHHLFDIWSIYNLRQTAICRTKLTCIKSPWKSHLFILFFNCDKLWKYHPQILSYDANTVPQYIIKEGQYPSPSFTWIVLKGLAISEI